MKILMVFVNHVYIHVKIVLTVLQIVLYVIQMLEEMIFPIVTAKQIVSKIKFLNLILNK